MDYTVMVRVSATGLPDLTQKVEDWNLTEGEFVMSISAQPTPVTGPMSPPPVPLSQPPPPPPAS